MTFSQELYDQIDEWFGQRSQIQQSHIQDLLATHGSNHCGVHAPPPSDNEGSGDRNPKTNNPTTVEPLES